MKKNIDGNKVKKIIFILLLTLNSLKVFAQDESTDVAAVQVGVHARVHINEAPFFNPGDFRVSVYGGYNRAAYEPQFVNMRNRYAFGFGFSGDFNRLSNLGFDIELIDVNRNYDTPIQLLWGSLDQDTRVETMAALFGIRAFIPERGAFNAYVSAGLGFFRTRMVVFGTLFGFPGYHDEFDTDFTAYHGVGMRYNFGRWGLSLDYRHYNLSGSFSSFKVSNANLSSDVYLAGWHYGF